MDLCGLGAAVSPYYLPHCLGAVGRKNPLTILQVTPKYMLLGGVIGAFITFTVIKSMDALGPAKAVMLIVIAQLLAAYLIELAGIFGVEKADFSWRKVIGMAAAIVGVACFSGSRNGKIPSTKPIFMDFASYNCEGTEPVMT